jgi:hypothetical protein
MGVSYFITPLLIENSQGKIIDELDIDYTIDPDQLADALRARWRDVQISVSSSSYAALYWECKVREPFGLNGVLQRDTQAIVLEKPGQHDVAEFATWFRGYVPSQYRLSLFNSSGFPKNLELRADTTYLQILHFFTHLDYVPTIVPFNDASFKVNRDDFQRKLKEQWPEAKVEPVQANDPYSFYWEIISSVQIERELPELPTYTTDALQSGAIDPNQATLYLHYYPDSEVAKFAVWYRSVIPSQHQLSLYIKAKKRSINLNTETTEQQIIEALKPMFL